MTHSSKTTHTHRPTLLRGVRAIGLAVALAMGAVNVNAEETQQFTDTVMASILVASPGQLIYQIAGHAALRLQCPAYNLDNVFTYESNNVGGLIGQLFGHSKGRFAATTLSNYIEMYSQFGRGVKEYPINLTDKQIRDLWRLCDEAVESRAEDEFNIRFHNCNERLMQKVTLAMWPDTICFQENELSRMTNGQMQKFYLRENRPWAAMILNVGSGTGADETDPWQTRLMPVAMPTYFQQAEIVSPDGSRRPLLSGNSTELVPQQWQPEPPLITPTVIGLAYIIHTITFRA
ncbi:MAG: DUF4105 domain-containing protein [Bacteroidales bacterium]|nr:DUF4105 domain-containing protein [Bacteroidales bacterium]